MSGCIRFVYGPERPRAGARPVANEPQQEVSRHEHLFKRWLILIGLVLAAYSGLEARADSQTLTPDQIEMLRRLPPELLQQLRQGPTDSLQATPPLSEPAVVRPRPVDGGTARSAAAATRQTTTSSPTGIELLPPAFVRRIAVLGLRERRELAAALREGRDPVGLPDDILVSLQGFRPEQLRAILVMLDPPAPDPAGTAAVIESTGSSDGMSGTVNPSPPPADEVLRPFGYDLFAGTPTTFAPATDIPVPTDYVIGPGDTVQIQLFGKENAQYDLVVGRDGTLSFPGLGPVPVAGMKFDELRVQLNQRVATQMIGMRANITLGALRSIRVFVLGEAERPGSYTVSALSTLTNALFVSGGIKTVGSLRKVQLKRAGETIATLDLYDLLLRGDTRNDVRLQPGDVIFVPPIGKIVGIAGAVRRPAIYELTGERTVADALALAGGLDPAAYAGGAQLERIDARQERRLIDIDLRTSASGTLELTSGDTLRVPRVLDQQESTVTLSGHVLRPGVVPWRRGLRVSQIVRSARELKSRPDTGYALILREQPVTRRLQVLSFDLGAALTRARGSADPLLQPNDELFVLGLDADRSRSLQPLIYKLRQQTHDGSAEPVVSLFGNVRHPGDYPLVAGMTVRDAVRAALDVLPETDLEYALIRRENSRTHRAETLPVRLGSALRESASVDNLRLQARDELYVFTRGADRQEQLGPILTELQAQAVRDDEAAIAEISGAVRMPGRYPYTPGMKIADLVRIAGGLAESAYTLGAELNRYRIVDGKLREVDHANFVLADALAGKPDVNVPLQPHDRLVVKPVTNWGEQESVVITGEVRFPGTYTIRKGEALSSVLKRAGGLTTYAFPRGAVFTRESLRKREQEQLDKLAARIETELTQSQLEKSQSPSAEGNASLDKEAIAISRSVVQQIRSTKALGRLVIDLPALLAGPQIAGLSRDGYEEIDVSLQPGDRLIIPQDTQEVTVLGEVFHGTSHLYRSGIDRDEYIRLSGGTTRKADVDNIFIVKSNGQVIGTGSGLFSSGILARTSTMASIEPGDTIIVPLDIERVKPLAFWSEVTKIIGQVGLTVAAFHSVGAL